MRAYIYILALLSSACAYADRKSVNLSSNLNDFTIEQSHLVSGAGCVATLIRDTPSGLRTYRAILRDLRVATEGECRNALTSTQPVVVRETVDYVEAANLLDVIHRCLKPEPRGRQECPEMSQNDRSQIEKLVRGKTISSIDYRYNTFRPWGMFICDSYELGGIEGCALLSFGIKEGKFSDVRATRIVH